MSPDTLLRDLDLALAGDPAADPEIAALVADVQADRPQMSAAFAAHLDELVDTGFAGTPTADGDGQDRHRRRRRLRLPALRPLTLAPIGALAAAAIAIVVLSSGGSKVNVTGDHGVAFKPNVLTTTPTPESAASGSAGDSTAEKHKPAAPSLPQADLAAPAPSSAAGSGASSSTSGLTTTSTPKAAGHEVERATTLELTTNTSKVQTTFDQVVAITQRDGGFIANSNVAVQGSSGSAQATLRIPAARLATALAAITKLGHVASISQQTLDITGEFASTNTALSQLKQQLRNLQRQRKTPGIRARIQQVQAQIAGQQQALTSLRHRADYVTVALTITGHKTHHGAVVHHKAGPWSPHHAAHVALRVLEISAGVALVALAILAVMLPFGALAFFGARGTRRRSREAALDAS